MPMWKRPVPMTWMSSIDSETDCTGTGPHSGAGFFLIAVCCLRISRM